MSEHVSECVSDDEITDLLNKAAVGDQLARDHLFEVLYPTLRELAAAQMRYERPGHTLQPTALVNEAILKMNDRRLLEEATDRCGFIAAAARAMRAVLVDHARRRSASKRPSGDNRQRHPLDETLEYFERTQRLDVMVLDEALRELSTLSQRQHDIVMLHFFGGLKFKQIADYIDVSLSTVEKDWRFARAWLRRALDENAE